MQGKGKGKGKGNSKYKYNGNCKSNGEIQGALRCGGKNAAFGRDDVCTFWGWVLGGNGVALQFRIRPWA
jgi:hypothetical protein